MKKVCTLLKKPQGILLFAFALILVGSFLAGLFHTSFYSVKIERITFETERGTLSALLYMPKGAGVNDPRPVIITTHGYLNTKEMQDAPAIEMSRRGFIVLALDMYDHGDSRWDGDIPVGTQFSTFWVHSQFDAAKYVYQQNYTKKDAGGNAYIAVSGHSMGGFSSFVALYMDEMTSLQTGYRMIHSGISVGSDFLYTGGIAPQKQFEAAFGSRTIGMVAAHYDEFFFNKSAQEKTPAERNVTGSVTYKDYPQTSLGKSFLGLDPNGPPGEAGRYYTVQSGAIILNEQVVRDSQEGRRIIYTPKETHPWNHFSKTTTAHLIEFYQDVFSDITSPNQKKANLNAENQIWWLKEAFNFVAFVGFIFLILALARLLLRAPFLQKAVVSQPETVAEAQTGKGKAFSWLVIIVSACLPAIFFVPLFTQNVAGMAPLSYAAYIVLGLCVVRILMAWLSVAKSNTIEKTKITADMSITALFAVALILWIAKAPAVVPLGRIFNQPTTNQIAYWAVASGLIAALVNVIVYYLAKKGRGTTFASYGIVPKPLVVLASLLTAILAVVGGYAILWLMQFLFTTDFRLWTLAVRTFKIEHFLTALRYMPFFFVFYFINTIGITANTRGFKKGGNVVAIALNCAPLIFWLALQYGMLFFKGVAVYPEQSLNAILLFALIPILGIAAVYARKLFEETGNVWLAAFVNTILFTMITAANTVTFWNLV